MEQDILKQLYFGEIVPCESRGGRTPETDEIADRIDGAAGRLKGMLGDEGKDLLERLLADASDLESRAACGGFKDGFRLGAQITAASLGSLKKP